MGLVIVLTVVVLIISYIIADEFLTIAICKGYNDRKYFWFCFLFGIAGYLMVVALPTKNGESNVDSHNQVVEQPETVKLPNKETKMVGNFPAQEFSEDSGIKQCPSCGTCHDSNLDSCPGCKHQYN